MPKGALRDEIYATDGFEGLTGTLSCSPSGHCSAGGLAMFEVTQEVVDGAWPPPPYGG